MTQSLVQLKKELSAFGTPERAKNSARFFKMAEGDYGAGDIFIGVTVPEQRTIAKKYIDLSLFDVEQLLQSPKHEFRLTALILLVEKYEKGSDAEKKKIHVLYLKNIKWINNWDLVDLSAGYLVGDYLRARDKTLLAKLAKSKSLWERRIAIVATYSYIKDGLEEETFRVAELLLDDDHDLIHKAVGWMLREVGKRCGQETEEVFLKKNYARMPRTMLRYAIERFPEKLRAAYMNGVA